MQGATSSRGLASSSRCSPPGRSNLPLFSSLPGRVRWCPAKKRFAICLIAPGVLLLARAAVCLWDAASARWRVLLTATTLAGWLMLADFQAHYFRFIRDTGGQSHLTFRTGPIEPKQAALQYIASRTPAGEETWIVASEWWNRWPLQYLALSNPALYVPDPRRFSGVGSVSDGQRRRAGVVR